MKWQVCALACELFVCSLSIFIRKTEFCEHFGCAQFYLSIKKYTHTRDLVRFQMSNCVTIALWCKNSRSYGKSKTTVDKQYMAQYKAIPFISVNERVTTSTPTYIHMKGSTHFSHRNVRLDVGQKQLTEAAAALIFAIVWQQ